MLDIVVAQLGTIGGPVLIVMLLVSIAATATSIFKIVQFAGLGVGRHRTARSALTLWAAGNYESALELAQSDGTALSAVAGTAMSALFHDPQDAARAQQLAVQKATTLLSAMGKYLRLIEAVVQAAPMLGLLGTVIGMIEAFGKVAQGGGAADPSVLAGGIWIALTTTALGLTIAIPFYFISVWLESRVDTERAAMDAAIAGVVQGP